MTDVISNYVAWLEKANADVVDKETRAMACLAQPGYAEAYKELMAGKAKVIMTLPDEFEREFSGDGLSDDPAALAVREEIAGRLQGFAQGAQNALSIGSPFYMSALLYPDDHQPGEPNNLELLIAELKRK